jgi:hypothetical protein
MVMGIAGPEIKNDCAGQDLQEITRPDITMYGDVEVSVHNS